jgi:rubrerythrin
MRFQAAPRRLRSQESQLSNTKTLQNLKDAFAGESMANRRYQYFAQKADVEGLPDVAAVFRSTAEGETGHAFGHLEFLEEVGDPVTGEPIGTTAENLKSAIAGETHVCEVISTLFLLLGENEQIHSDQVVFPLTVGIHRYVPWLR